MPIGDDFDGLATTLSGTYGGRPFGGWEEAVNGYMVQGLANHYNNAVWRGEAARIAEATALVQHFADVGWITQEQANAILGGHVPSVAPRPPSWADSLPAKPLAPLGPAPDLPESLLPGWNETFPHGRPPQPGRPPVPGSRPLPAEPYGPNIPPTAPGGPWSGVIDLGQGASADAPWMEGEVVWRPPYGVSLYNKIPPGGLLALFEMLNNPSPIEGIHTPSVLEDLINHGGIFGWGPRPPTLLDQLPPPGWIMVQPAPSGSFWDAYPGWKYGVTYPTPGQWVPPSYGAVLPPGTHYWLYDPAVSPQPQPHTVLGPPPDVTVTPAPRNPVTGLPWGVRPPRPSYQPPADNSFVVPNSGFVDLGGDPFDHVGAGAGGSDDRNSFSLPPYYWPGGGYGY